MAIVTKITPGEIQPARANLIEIDFARRTVQSRLTVYKFEDHGYMVCYAPSLNLSAYGSNLEEAREMMNVVIEDYLTRVADLPKAAAFEELSKLGWHIRGASIQNFENTAYIDKDGVLKNFDLPQDTVIEEQLIGV